MLKIRLKIENNPKGFERCETRVSKYYEIYRRPLRKRVLQGKHNSTGGNFSFYIPGSKELATTEKIFLFCSAKL